MTFPTVWKNKSHVPNHQPVLVISLVPRPCWFVSFQWVGWQNNYRGWHGFYENWGFPVNVPSNSGTVKLLCSLVHGLENKCSSSYQTYRNWSIPIYPPVNAIVVLQRFASQHQTSGRGSNGWPAGCGARLWNQTPRTGLSENLWCFYPKIPYPLVIFT